MKLVLPRTGAKPSTCASSGEVVSLNWQVGDLVGDLVELVGDLVELVAELVGELVGELVVELVGKLVKLVGELVELVAELAGGRTSPKSVNSFLLSFKLYLKLSKTYKVKPLVQ